VSIRDTLETVGKRARLIACVSIGVVLALQAGTALAQSTDRTRTRADVPPGFDESILREADKAIRMRNPKRAVALWREAARVGDPEALYRLGNAYRSGIGVEKDHVQAAAWYHKAAALRHPDARFALGTLYQFGWGVPADRDRALRLYGQAASAGHTEAKRRLDEFGKSGSVVTASGSARVAASRGDPNRVLAQAVRAGDVGAARDALARGANVLGPLDETFPAPLLFEAVRRDDHALVKVLLEHRADPNTPLDSGETLLVRAVRDAEAATVHALLAAGARVDERIPGGSTALIEAARVGKIEVASTLLAGGASANAVLEDGTSAADVARRFGHNRLASLLRRRGAPSLSEPDAGDRLERIAESKSSRSPDASELPPIVEAGRRGDTQLLGALIARSPDVDRRDSEGDRALGRAAEAGHAEAVAMLLAAGADANTPDREGRTPLMRAAASGSPNADETVETLLAAGADPNARDRRGRSVLYFLSEAATERKVELLSKTAASWLPADRSDAISRAERSDDPVALRAILGLAQDSSDLSGPLCTSIAEKRSAAVEIIIEHGAAPDTRCEDGTTPLVLASRSGDQTLVRILIGAGSDPATPAQSGDTALIAAASRGHAEIVRALLEAGASVDQRGERRVTALMAAATNGRLEVVDLLLDAGANPLHRDESSQRATELAEAGGHRDVAERLRSRRSSWKSWVGLSGD
jgi:serine/threonine-protein phosphatase 6 regulatory ankyrin repeat subunit B